MATTTRSCNNCNTQYQADNRNLKRGWGLTCSKSCAASLREKAKPGYDPKRVTVNNFRRENWKEVAVDENEYGVFKGRYTSEGYKMYERENDEYTAVDKFGDEVYDGVTWYEDEDDSEYWNDKD